MHPEPADAGDTSESAFDDPLVPLAAGADALHGDETASKKRTRSRDGKNIIFRVYPEEHDDISARATEAGLTISEFIRRVVTGHKTQSRFDYDVIENLIRIHTDMSRLGNLFKLSLKQISDDECHRNPMSYADRERQRSVLKLIEDNQELLRNYIQEFTA